MHAQVAFTVPSLDDGPSAKQGMQDKWSCKRHSSLYSWDGGFDGVVLGVRVNDFVYLISTQENTEWQF